MLDEARKLIKHFANVSRSEFDLDEDLSAAAAWRLSVIGEAASRISPESRDRSPLIPWQQIVGMRHRLIHGYDAIDVDVVWQTVKSDLPELV